MDVALIRITDKQNVGKGSICCFEATEYLGKNPKLKEKVKICSASNNRIKIGEIKSKFCFKRKRKGKKAILKNLIQTTNMASHGDSGSVVVNMQNEPVGLMVWDRGKQYSYFMLLDFLKSKILKKFKTHTIEFKFKKFL